MKKNNNFFYYCAIFVFIVCIAVFGYSACSTYNIQYQVKEAVKNDIDIQNKQKVADCLGKQETNTPFLDILEKSNSIIGASELTFFFTFIVAVLSIFFMYKNEELKNTIDDIKNMKSEVEKNYKKLKQINRFDQTLNRIASIFNLSIMIGNVIMTLFRQNSDEENTNISTEIGSLCSRISLICDQITNCRLSHMATDEKDILTTYLDDALNGLDSSLRRAARLNIVPLNIILEGIIERIQYIRDVIDSIEIQDE